MFQQGYYRGSFNHFSSISCCSHRLGTSIRIKLNSGNVNIDNICIIIFFTHKTRSENYCYSTVLMWKQKYLHLLLIKTQITLENNKYNNDKDNNAEIQFHPSLHISPLHFIFLTRQMSKVNSPGTALLWRLSLSSKRIINYQKTDLRRCVPAHCRFLRSARFP